jgi:hypothetical protein
MVRNVTPSRRSWPPHTPSQPPSKWPNLSEQRSLRRHDFSSSSRTRPGRAPAEWGAGVELLTLTELRHIHRLTVGPVWEFFPPDNLDPDEGPGSFRHHEIATFSGGMKPPAFTDVAAEVADWLRLVNGPPEAAGRIMEPWFAALARPTAAVPSAYSGPPWCAFAGGSRPALLE